MEKALADKLTSVVSAVEQQVDEQIERLQNLGTDDLEKLREARLKQMKKAREQQLEWKALGHGEYSEVPEEKQLFDVAKKSKNVVCHFYREETFRCKIVDKHLKILAAKHMETKFCKIDALKCPFLTEKLRVVVLPSILLFDKATVVDRIIGFTDLGNCDDFDTEMLEWRIAQKDVIAYNGDKMNPPEPKDRRSLHSRRTMRLDLGDRSDDSDEEFEDAHEPGAVEKARAASAAAGSNGGRGLPAELEEEYEENDSIHHCKTLPLGYQGKADSFEADISAPDILNAVGNQTVVLSSDDDISQLNTLNTPGNRTIVLSSDDE